MIADDHPLFRSALGEAVRSIHQDAIVEEAGDLDSALHLLDREQQIELVFLDLKMPGAHGFSGLIFLRGQYPETPIVIVSGIDDIATMRQAIRFGASGFIPKSLTPAEIANAIKRVLEGETWLPASARTNAITVDGDSYQLADRIALLSAQQFKVLALIAEGLLNKQIAYQLNLSISTVKAHTTGILKKLGLQRRTQILAAARIAHLDSYRIGLVR